MNNFITAICIILILGLAPRSSAGGAKNQAVLVTSYSVDIQLDFKSKFIRGLEIISILKDDAEEAELKFPSGNLEIDSIEVDGLKGQYQKTSNVLTIRLPATKERRVEVTITYHGQDVGGLVWGNEYVYTDFDSCAWMFCETHPSPKVPFEMTVTLPKDYSVVASGLEIEKINLPKGLVSHKWKESRPYSSYLFGFAAGKFTEAHQNFRGLELSYFGVTDDASSLQKKFKDTELMIDFLEEKSGVELPHGKYVQVLVPDDEAQEKSSFSIIGKSFLDPILIDPQEDWVIVHELAHQWWGNLLTCKDWSHFWLNEGITVFMVAAYKEKRWGRAAYDQEISVIKKRYQYAIDEKFDVALTYSGPYPSLKMKRAISYSKGALFMDALRTFMGEKAFWAGLKKYTQKNIGKSVTSQEFQIVMEKSARKGLRKIFNKWVY